MPRNFDFAALAGKVDHRSPRFYLQAGLVLLTLANIAALFFYIAPPGGSRKDLLDESDQVRRQIASTRAGANRLQTIAGKVQAGSMQSTEFQSRYFLQKRLAYDRVISEIQQMAKASGVTEREGVFSEEPIEGSADLSILNITSSYEGTYDNLMHFLYEADRSPMLLMLDTLQAAPQQRGQQINASIRFQAILRDEPSGSVGGQQ